MVAPNSPIALAKPSTMPASDAGQRQRQRHGGEHPPRRCAERARRLLEPPVDRFDRQPDRPHQQRKRHHAAGQRRAGPAERRTRFRDGRRATRRPRRAVRTSAAADSR